MPAEIKEREERPRRSSRSRNTSFPVGPALGVVGIVVLAYFGSQMIAEGSAPEPVQEPSYVPFANVKDEAPPDLSNRLGSRWVKNAPEGLAASSAAFAAARRLAAQGEKFLAAARAADAAGDSAKARGLRKQAHTAYDQAFTDTAMWEMEIEEAYSDRDRQVEQIKKERSRWMARIIALHKTTGR
jgi:hypothetical protein